MFDKLRIDARLDELKELESMKAEIDRQIDAIKDDVKASLQDMGLNEMVTLKHKVTWKDVATSRFDSKSFKTDFPDVYDAYCRSVVSKRFVVD